MEEKNVDRLLLYFPAESDLSGEVVVYGHKNFMGSLLRGKDGGWNRMIKNEKECREWLSPLKERGAILMSGKEYNAADASFHREMYKRGVFIIRYG